MREYFIRMKMVVTSGYFYICLLLATGLFFLSSVEMTSGESSISVFEKIIQYWKMDGETDFLSSYELLVRSTPGMYVVVFLPVVSALPGIFAYFEEKDSRYFLFSVLRTSRKKHEYSWLFVQISSTVIVMSLSYVIFALLLYVMQPLLATFDDEMAVYYNSMFKSGYELKRTTSLALYASFIAVLSMLLAKVFESRQVVLGAVFSFVYCYSAVIYRIMRATMNKGDYEAFVETERYLPINLMNLLECSNRIIIVFVVVLVVILIGYMIGTKKRKNIL